MSIYVNFPKPPTIREFLERFFSLDGFWNGSCAVQTYHDKECTKLQCHPQKNRSIQDIEECINTYFPGTSLKQIMEELVMLRIPGKTFTPYRCVTIKRPVVQFSENEDWQAKHFKIPRTAKTKYSWGRLLREELGIKTKSQMLNYTPNEQYAG